ncbi:MAG: ABC transporter ATP-binding protein [Dehalococcoidia bacterium]
MVLLDVCNLTKTFGGLTAINDLNISVVKGEILGLIGPNGAGKTTALNMISGSISPTRGKCTFKNEDITGLPPHRISKKGISRVFQGNVLFYNLTVMNNVLLGMHMRDNLGFWSSVINGAHSRNLDRKMYEKACDILELFGLADKTDEIAINLSHGNQRLLCMSIALASDPDLLLLDEPVSGMNDQEVTAMLSLIRKLQKNSGITIILVEHNMRAVMNLCDRIVVISYGAKIAEGSPGEITNNPVVIEAYLGTEDNVV